MAPWLTPDEAIWPSMDLRGRDADAVDEDATVDADEANEDVAVATESSRLARAPNGSRALQQRQ